MIEYIDKNYPNNAQKTQIIGELLYREILKTRPDAMEALAIVNTILNSNITVEGAYNVLENLSDDIPLIIAQYDAKKVAAVFADNLQGNQDWVNAMEEARSEPLVPEPKSGKILQFFQNTPAGKAAAKNK